MDEVKITMIGIETVLLDRLDLAANLLGIRRDFFIHQLLERALRSSNQTDPVWLKSSPQGELGTGVFLVPDVESTLVGAMKKIMVPGITYLDCVRRGRNVFFQWVPIRVASYEELPGQSCQSHHGA